MSNDPRQWPPRAARDETAGAGGEPDAGLFGRLKRGLNTLRDLAGESVSVDEPTRVLSYREVVGYLAANQPRVPGARGALLRQRRIGQWLYRMFYLDADGQPIVDPATQRRVGAHVVASGCDDELAELFGSANLIVFD